MNLYAWVAKDNDGNEYIIGWETADGVIPLVSSQKKQAESAKPVALSHQETTGHTVRFVSFVERKHWMR